MFEGILVLSLSTPYDQYFWSPVRSPVWFSTLLTGRFICNCLHLNQLSNKSLAKRCQWRVVLTDSCRGSNLVMRTISESYREFILNHACQEGRNFAPVHAIWECGYRCDPAAREPPIIAAPYGNVGIVVTCPYSRTMFEGVLVFCCPCHISMRVSLWPVPIVEPCLRVSLFCHCPRYMTSTFDLRCDFRPSWQADLSVIVCISIN